MQIELSDREIAQLLAALRNWQTDSLNEDLADAFAGPAGEPARRQARLRRGDARTARGASVHSAAAQLITRDPR